MLLRLDNRQIDFFTDIKFFKTAARKLRTLTMTTHAHTHTHMQAIVHLSPVLNFIHERESEGERGSHTHARTLRRTHAHRVGERDYVMTGSQ